MVTDIIERISTPNYPPVKKGLSEFLFFARLNNSAGLSLHASDLYLRETKKYNRHFQMMIIHHKPHNRLAIASRISLPIQPKSFFDVNQLGVIWGNGPTCEVKIGDLQSIRSILGTQGMQALEETVSLICLTSNQLNWPLAKIEINDVSDPEILDWQYVCLLLFFNSNFESADSYLHKLYPILDDLTKRFSAEQAEIMQKSIFFDVQTTLQQN